MQGRSLLFGNRMLDNRTHPEPMNNSFRLITYNIRYDNPADGDNAWAYRCAAVAALLQQYAPDLIGLQEVLKAQLADLTATLLDFAWVGVGREDGQTQGEYAPIFYRHARFELLATDTFWLSKTPEQPGSFGWDAACVRIATWARLRDKQSGATLLMLNTHFDHRGQQAQVESAHLVRTFLNAQSPPSPAIITGDFNCTAQSSAYQQLTTAAEMTGSPLLDSQFAAQTPHRGPSATFNTNFADPLHEKIDFVFIWPGDTFGIQQHAILDEQTQGRYPSDHLPILVELALAA